MNMRQERLGDLCDIRIGRTPPRADPQQWDASRSTSNVWVSIADLTAAKGGIISSSKEHISDVAATAGQIVPAGTLLLSFKLSIGRLAVTGCDLFTNEAIAALRLPARSPISRKFLHHYLSSVDWMAVARGNEKVKGATLNKKKLSELRIPVPTSAEQRRIVALLDEATQHITALESTYAQTLRQYDAFRASSLSSVLVGEGLSEMRELDDVAAVEYGERVVRARDGGTVYPVYGGGGPTFSIDRYNREDCYIVSRFGMSETCVRRVQGRFFLNDSGLSVRTSDASVVCQEYLDRVLLANQTQIYAMSTGTAQKNLDVPSFRKFPIPVPSIRDQHRLVRAYDEAEEFAELGHALTRKRIDQVHELRHSVLEAAFRGDL